jgi:nitrous oxide reductase accessory protein NosL
MAETELTRRTLLAAGATGGLAGFAGCVGGTAVPDPAAIAEGQTCENCNMVINRHPGPVAQTYYLDDAPPALQDRDDGHGRFCSTWCLYRFTFEMKDRDYQSAGSYATDYSTVDYQIEEYAGTAVIDPDPHLGAESFSRAESLSFVVDSDVEGAMGESLVGFSGEDAATEFVDEHGGERLDEDEISPELISAL